MAELEFRDGKRIVPDYMETLMAGMPLHKLTYKQAVKGMNEHNLNQVVDRSFDRIIDAHFRDRR